jgi:hypothetical protein
MKQNKSARIQRKKSYSTQQDWPVRMAKLPKPISTQYISKVQNRDFQ